MQEQDIVLKDGSVIFTEDNTIHRYMRPQNEFNFRDNVFIMESEFKTRGWAGYLIPYYDRDSTLQFAYFKHSTVERKGAVTTKPNFANGSPFIKMRLSDKDNAN